MSAKDASLQQSIVLRLPPMKFGVSVFVSGDPGTKGTVLPPSAAQMTEWAETNLLERSGIYSPRWAAVVEWEGGDAEVCMIDRNVTDDVLMYYPFAADEVDLRVAQAEQAAVVLEYWRKNAYTSAVQAVALMNFDRKGYAFPQDSDKYHGVVKDLEGLAAELQMLETTEAMRAKRRLERADSCVSKRSCYTVQSSDAAEDMLAQYSQEPEPETESDLTPGSGIPLEWPGPVDHGSSGAASSSSGAVAPSPPLDTLSYGRESQPQ